MLRTSHSNIRRAELFLMKVFFLLRETQSYGIFKHLLLRKDARIGRT
jgi:hypothetical protein